MLNESSACHKIAPMIRGMEGIVSTEAAKLLADTKSAQNNKELDFIEKAHSFGWLVDGKFNGTYRRIKTKNHLKKIQIEITTRCNLRCSYCYSASGPKNLYSLSREHLLKLVGEADKLGIYEADLTGGEVMLHPSWSEIVEILCSKNIATTIHTNGTLLTDKNVDLLAATNVKSISISLDSHQAELHDQVRSQKGSFDRAVKGAQRSIKKGLHVRIVLMVHKLNYKVVVESIDFLKAIFGQEIELVVDRVISTGRALGTDLALSPSEYYEAIAQLSNKKIAVSNLSCQAIEDRSTIEPNCGVGSSFIYISSMGEFMLCPTLSSREDKIFAGPSIKEYSLAKAWSKHNLFKKYRNVQCKNISSCPEALLCKGGCRSNAYLESGHIDFQDVLSCNHYKNTSCHFTAY